MNLLLLNKRIWVEDEEMMYIPGVVVGVEGDRYRVEVWVEGRKEYRFVKEGEEIVEVMQNSFYNEDLMMAESVGMEYLLMVMRRRFEMNQGMTRIGRSFAMWVDDGGRKRKRNGGSKRREDDLAMIREYCGGIIYEKTKKVKKMIMMSSSDNITMNSRSSVGETNVNEAIVLFGQSLSGKSTLSTKIIETFIDMSDSDKTMIMTTLEIIRLFTEVGKESKSCLSINLTVDMNNIKITSLKITPYIILLNHLTSTNPDTNFNIFSLLINTMNDKDKEKYSHKESNYFNTLQSTYQASSLNHNQSITSLDQLKTFLVSFAIHQENIETLLSILMAILYLGNLQFMKDPSNNQIDIHPQSKDNLKAISSLLSIEFITLKELFSKCKNTTEASLLLTKITIHLYRQTLDWLINHINNHFNERENDYTAHNSQYPLNKKTITIIDSIGYTNKAINSIDDFISNYSNERLVELFTKTLVGVEQEEYKRESLQWKEVDYYNNAEVISLIDNKGLIDLLDATSNEAMMRMMSNEDNDDGSDYDKIFYTKTYQSYSNSIALGIKSDSFITINHSFGDVYYYINGVVNRNIKALSRDVRDVFENSKCGFISQLFNENDSHSHSHSHAGNNNESLVKYYKKRIDELITLLSHSHLRFIRCFRPNVNEEEGLQREFNSHVMYSQLITSNIVPIGAFMKKRFSHKISFNDFIGNYAYLNKEAMKLVKEIQPISSSISFKNRRLSKAMNSTANMLNLKGIVTDIISIFKRYKPLQSKLSNMQIGLTMIYLDNTSFNALNHIKDNIHHIKLLQKNLRKFLTRLKTIKYIQQKYRKYTKGKLEKKLLALKQKRAKESEMPLTPIKNNSNNPSSSNVCNTARAFSTQKIRQKTVLNILTKDKQNNQVETELLQIIKTLQDEISLLKNMQIDNETLKQKNTSLLLQISTLESEMTKQKGEERDLLVPQRNSTSKSALALITEISALKKKIKENEIKIETQQIALHQNGITIEDLKKLNNTLQEQISKRSKGDLNELNQLMERIAAMEQEKKDYEIKVQSFINKSMTDGNGDLFGGSMSSRQVPLTERDGGGRDNKSISDYKKIISTLKTDLKHTKTSIDELKAHYLIEIDKTKALTDQVALLNKRPSCDRWINSLSLSAKEVLVNIPRIKKKHSSRHDVLAKENEIVALKEQLSNCIEKHHKIEEAYKEQLLIKSKELEQRYTNIKSLQESLDQQMDQSIQRRKEVMNMKSNQLNHNDNDDTLRRKNEEVSKMKEMVRKKKSLCNEMRRALRKKRNVIQKKKEENCLLVELFRNKKIELQCLEGLKYANSTSIKEKLIRIQDNEKELIKKVEIVVEDDDYSDDNDNEYEYEEEDQDQDGYGDDKEEKENENDLVMINEYTLKHNYPNDENDVQQHSSIDSFGSINDNAEDGN